MLAARCHGQGQKRFYFEPIKGRPTGSCCKKIHVTDDVKNLFCTLETYRKQEYFQRRRVNNFAGGALIVTFILDEYTN